MHKSIYTILLVSFYIFFLSLSADSGNYTRGFPRGPEPAADPAPFDYINKIASEEAASAWGNCFLLDIIPCAGPDGRLNVYFFVFRISPSAPSDYEEIISGIKKAKNERRKAAEKGNRKNYEKAKRKMWGEGEFGTIVMSASYDTVPVVERIYGLPPFYTGMEEMTGLARENTGCDPKLTFIYYFSPVDHYYEFSCGSKSIVISSYPYAAVSRDKIRNAAGRSVKAGEREKKAYKEYVKKAWEQKGGIK